MTDLKDSNPKTAAGQPKPAMEFVPPVALLHLAEAHRHGAEKYGAFNWRELGVSETTYYSAIQRHLFAWFDGQEFDPESGCHHLAHVMACCAIVMDADSVGMLTMDRPHRGAASNVIAALTTQRRHQQDEAKREQSSVSESRLSATINRLQAEYNDPTLNSPDLPYRRKDWTHNTSYAHTDLASMHDRRIGAIVEVNGRAWQRVTHEVFNSTEAYSGRADAFSVVRFCEPTYPESYWVPLD